MNEKLALRLKALLNLCGYEASIRLTNSAPPRYVVEYWDGPEHKMLTWQTTLEELTFLTE